MPDCMLKEGMTMFDDVLRELERLEQGVEISIEVPLDEKGFLDRQCPSKPCQHQFKVLFDDWTDKVPDESAFCPLCGHTDHPHEMSTPAQEEYIHDVGLQHVSGIIDKALVSDAQRHNRKERARPKNGLIDISMSMEFKPGAPIIAVPPDAAESLRQEFACDSCQCHWSSLGASYFCPACGHNSAPSAFNTTLTTVRDFIHTFPALQRTLEEAAGPDSAETTLRQLAEDQFGRIVGAFERYSAALFSELPNASAFPAKGNVFQRIPDASALWKAAVGKGYDDVLTSAEVAALTRFVQQRHVLGHQQGIVDDKYIAKSGDTNYCAGQRLVIRPQHVIELIDVVEKLAASIRAALP